VDAISNYMAVAWYTGHDNRPEVKVAFSDDGGHKFQKPVRIDEGQPLGRVDVVMLNEASAMVSWMEGAVIKVVKVYSNGKKDTAMVVAASSSARSSGFPQMTRSANSLIFAWTDSETKSIKVASLRLED
jgi:hypothetical protein